MNDNESNHLENINTIVQNSIEEYISEFFETITTQLNILAESRNKKSSLSTSRHCDIRPGLNPLNLNIIIDRLFHIKKQKLSKEFRQKLDKINRYAKNNKIDLEVYLDTNQYAKSLHELMRKIDNFSEEIKSQLETSNNLRNEKISQSYERLTDFSSDTETYQQSKFLPKKRCRELYRDLKQLVQNESYSSEDENAEPINCKTVLHRSNSDSEIHNFFIDLDTIQPKNHASPNCDYDSYSSSFSSSIDSLFNYTSSSLGDESFNLYPADDDENNDRMILDGDENNTPKEAEPLGLSNQEKHDKQNMDEDENDDCIIVESTNKVMVHPKLDKIIKLIELLPKFNSSQSQKRTMPVHLNMRVLALKNPTKHEWKLGKIVRIFDFTEVQTEECKEGIIFQNEKVINLIKSKKYRVLFDSDTDSKNDSNDTSSCGSSSSSSSDSNSDSSSHGSTNSSQLGKKKRKKSKKTSGFRLHAKKVTLAPKSDRKPIQKQKKLINCCADLEADSVAFLHDYDDIAPSGTLGWYCHTRVVTLLKINVLEKKEKLYAEEYMCSGTVIEMASQTNLHRCLILFDNGVTQYVKPSLLFPIFDLYSYPYNRFHPDHTEFLNYYFKMFPQRVMIRLGPDTKINVFLNKKWEVARVIDTDCSLVKIEFSVRLFTENRSDSIRKRTFALTFYRGSFSLYQIYEATLKKITQTKNTVNLSDIEKYVLDKRDLNTKDSLTTDTGTMSIFSSTIIPFKEPVHSKSKFQYILKKTP